MKFDLTKIPFSRYGSYMALASLPANWQGHGNAAGLYLKTVSGSASSTLVAKIDLSDIDFSSYLDGGLLTLSANNLTYDFCYPDPQTLIIRGYADSHMLLDFMTENGPYDYIYERKIDRKSCYIANCYKNSTSFVIWAQDGKISLEQH